MGRHRIYIVGKRKDEPDLDAYVRLLIALARDLRSQSGGANDASAASPERLSSAIERGQNG